MKQLILLFLATLSTFPFHIKAQKNTVQQAIDSFVSSEGLQHAGVSFKCIDLSNTNLVAEHQPLLSLAPASTMKLYSTAAAYELIGSDFTPSTRIYTDGSINEEGILTGNIWVRGGGDPTLGSTYFYTKEQTRDFLNQWVTFIRNKGIKEIQGSIIVDGSEFGYEGAPEGWTWGDLGNYYGAGPSGIVVFDNTINFDFKTSSNEGENSEINCLEPHVEELQFRNNIFSAPIKHDNAYIYGAPYSFERFGLGTLPQNRTSFVVKGSIPDPEWLLAQEFHFELSQYITITTPPKAVRKWSITTKSPIDYTNKVLLFEHHGKSVDAIAYWTNQKSVNLFAEQLVSLIGYIKTGNGSISTSRKIVHDFWSPKVGNGLTINDGSGLSRKNASNASNFIQLLSYMYRRPSFSDFKQSLPIAGKSGTLSRLCNGQACFGRIIAKSGTMSNIKAYAGYVETKTGKNLAFALIVNNHTISNSQLTQKIQHIFNSMANY